MSGEPPQVEEFDPDNCYFYLVAFHWAAHTGQGSMTGYVGTSFYTPKKIDNGLVLSEVTKMCQSSIKLTDQHGPVVGVVPQIAILNVVELAAPKNKAAGSQS